MPRPPQLLAAALGLAAFAVAATADAGPWVRDPGGAYVKVGAARFTAEDSFNQGVSTGLAYESMTWNVYGEVGLPGRFQLVADLPFVDGRNNSEAGVNYINRTLGDARVQLDYGLFEDLPLTLSLEAKLPLYTPIARQDTSDPIASFPRSAVQFPDAGDGNLDLTPKVQFGHSFHPVPAWATAELGYRARFDDFGDGVFFAASAGLFVWPEHIAIGVFGNGVINLQTDDDPLARATKEFVYVQANTFVTLAPWLKGASLSLSVGTIPWANSTAAGSDVGLGVAYEL